MKSLHDVSAPAKLNLFLHVVGRREDGYHLLQSLFVLIDWADSLHFETRADGRLARHDIGRTELPADDLCLRAARALQTASGCPLGVDIHLEKRVPSGAGMGGGSSDAASTLLALNRLWGLGWPLPRLLELGLTLGADVPFFLGGHNALVEGIGEILHPLELQPRRFAVLKGPSGLATREIFGSPLLARSQDLAIVAGFPAHAGAANLVKGLGCDFGRNDLQDAAEALCSDVRDAIQGLRRVFGNARMTGSGSAVFARLGEGRHEVSGSDDQSLATLLRESPAGWTGRICHSLAQHPLVGWAG